MVVLLFDVVGPTRTTCPSVWSAIVGMMGRFPFRALLLLLS